MPHKTTRPAGFPAKIQHYDAILSEVVDLLEAARHSAARAVNAVMTATYWQIGRRIVEAEQAGKGRVGPRTNTQQRWVRRPGGARWWGRSKTRSRVGAMLFETTSTAATLT